jgi:hypothetical protein
MGRFVPNRCERAKRARGQSQRVAWTKRSNIRSGQERRYRGKFVIAHWPGKLLK